MKSTTKARRRSTLAFQLTGNWSRGTVRYGSGYRSIRDQLEIDAAEVWVVFLLETERKEDGTLRGLAVSFETLIGLFQAVRKQLK